LKGTVIPGINVTEWICLNSNNKNGVSDGCAVDFNFLNVQTTVLGTEISGIFGLCANSAGLIG
jgi:hypothetical protein